MKFAVLVIAFLLFLQTVQALFLGTLLLALPLSPIIFTSGLVGLKVALAAKLLSIFGNFFTGHYSLGLRAGSGIRGLEPTLLQSAAFNSSANATSGPWTESANNEDLLGPAIATTTEFFAPTLKEVDDDGCVSRLVCENFADASRFGKLGGAVVRYFGKQVPVRGGPGAAFFAAATTGRLQGVKGCASTFSNCTADLPEIVGMAGLM
ncbi:secreted protein, putative [Ixodes scapularis]|uniref:Secreted protein, putative n=1 Tax=Ixodes scapularis TaxID=6945 RepID=B7P1J9_IXOSC|nr:secreted protein, putative [Ixodes scapularis]|eukprot:XP_002433407.1 secreted protein, putative [Ixodes scapularis]